MMFFGFTPIEITQILVGFFGMLNVGFGLLLFLLKRDVHEIKAATNGLMAARDKQIGEDSHAEGFKLGALTVHAEADKAAIRKAEQNPQS